MKEPRNQHYRFAHRILPTLFLGNPGQFLAALETHGDRFIRECWKGAGSWLSRLMPVPPLAHQVTRQEDGTTVVLVTLPPPRGLTEAHFVALVLRPGVDGDTARARVFTLEHGFNIDGTPRTVVGEWAAPPGGGAPRHLNYGLGPEATAEAFLASVRQRLSHPTAPAAVWTPPGEVK